MKVRAKSINRVGEFVAFQYTQLPQLGIEKGQLVQRLGPPPPMVLIAFKDQFAIGPITDLEPVWKETVKIDKVADIAEKEREEQNNPIAGLELPESARVTASPAAEGETAPIESETVVEQAKAAFSDVFEGRENADADSEVGEGTAEQGS